MKNGAVWLVDLTDAKGHEQRGMRPAIIVGSANGLVLVVPLTSSMGSARFSHTLPISPDSHNGLDTESVALVFQIVALDRERFRDRIGAVSEQHRLAIVALIRDLLGLD
ncbi:MAG: type II toxin-antitoxin system PemK/MazF family toxin [Methanoregula sp.]|jgi:mRNA interferase MazF|uniref:type II toxin-antitoxin system PemK/MazF family toxin n=1 Tax=Methanoregula sp. TaxID=2052170 RepID=UPI0025F24E32|nr:type II toxin-antitoxin system PemK/MazF family toxin [Methanoregula sp.]MCK9632035.1 type II toxin-antitoxin system PemK/MazF family toxin [Methanoregula sp.]